MTMFLLAIFFLLLSIGGVIVRKTYSYKPLREVKRLAAKKDPFAVKVYPAVAYQGSLRLLLAVWIGLTSAEGFVLLARVATPLLSFVAVTLLVWAAFSWLPSSRITGVGARLTSLVTPAIVLVLGYLFPVLSRVNRLFHRRHTADTHPTAHTGMFERQDFIELLELQEHQADNRLSHEELEIAKRALSFDDFSVGDILIPRKKIKVVMSDDTLGPVLYAELHKNGQDHVLVRDEPKGEFTGTLDFRQVDINHTDKVSAVMSKKAYYLHERDPLSQALHAFFVTNEAVFIVVNGHEEYVGIVSIEAVLQQLLGHIPGEDFSEYASKGTVANRHIKPEPVEEPEEELVEEPKEQPVDEPAEEAPEVEPSELSDEPAEQEVEEKPQEPLEESTEKLPEKTSVTDEEVLELPPNNPKDAH